MFGRVQEALSLAQSANNNAQIAISEIRAHAQFCTERESKRDKEHSENQRAIGTLRGWITGLVFTVAGAMILQLLGVCGYLLAHFVVK